ncbi:putative glycosyl hydrolase, family 13, catalytic domain, alpha-amylase, Alpha-amylase, domain C [Septoria linicola]|nr:putative glycosyl hydrolase, family 13, catalytic domain, alpha-amylase, Alpha-amylase, domain C [Septoria linicola]
MNSLLWSITLGAILLNATAVNAATLDEWRGRTIYQVLTDRFARSDGSTDASCEVVDGRYCGGSWKGIKDQLDYIQGMNFDAIWMSPVVSQLDQTTIDGEAYTGYWAQDLYALNERFGTAEDLRDLIDELHRRGMYIMFDIVVNHMAYAGHPRQLATQARHLNPFNDEKYYHSYCPVDGDDRQTTEVCWLGSNTVPLADLRTEKTDVREMFGDWIGEMVSNYSIDGLRIDTALNVEPGFFPDFVDASNVFNTGETMDGDNSFVCRWADTIGSILNYPIYYPLIRTFSSPEGNINDLITTIYTMRENCKDPTAYGIFSENHDVQRFTELTNDTAQAKNVLAFNIMADGIPIIYQGQEQHMTGGVNPYTNRAPMWHTEFDTNAELYKHIADLVLARQHFALDGDDYTASENDVIYQDYHTFALRKGKGDKQVITVLNNNGHTSEDFEIEIKGHKLEHGTTVLEVLSCTRLTVSKSGILTVPMGSGLPKVIYPEKHLKNSGLCGEGEPLPKPSPTIIATTYATTINGHSTMVATSATSSPKHSKLAIGGAPQDRATTAALPVLAAVLSILLASSSAFLYRLTGF